MNKFGSKFLIYVSGIFLAFVLISTAYGQSRQVIGGSSFAKACFRASINASLNNMASHSDLQQCNQALQHGQLSKSDLIATYVNRGILHVTLGDLKKAAKDYNRALEMSDNIGEAYVNRGNLWFAAQRYDEAIKDYNTSIKHDVSKPHVALANRGLAYEYLKDYANAQSSYMEALELVPDWPYALTKLERVNKKLN